MASLGCGLVFAVVAVVLVVPRGSRGDDELVAGAPIAMPKGAPVAFAASTVSVSATGEVKARPTTVEIALLAAGSAELSSDALVKYRTSVRRTLDAFSKLKMERLSIAQEEITIGGQNNEGPNAYVAVPNTDDPTEKVRSEVRIARTLRLKLSGADKLSEDQLIETIVKLIDVAKDSGNAVVGEGSPAMVVFSVDKSDVLRDKAAAAAMEQARTRAAKYAELAGARLGNVMSVSETGVDSGSISIDWPSPYVYPHGGYPSPIMGATNDMVSQSLGEIPMRVSLHVSFAMFPKDASPTNTAEKKNTPEKK